MLMMLESERERCPGESEIVSTFWSNRLLCNRGYAGGAQKDCVVVFKKLCWIVGIFYTQLLPALIQEFFFTRCCKGSVHSLRLGVGNGNVSRSQWFLCA